MNENIILQVDPCDDSKVFFASETTKQPLSLSEVLHLKHFDIKDIPSTAEDCEKYFQEYQHNNPDSLLYLSSFWIPVSRTGIEIEFCCLDKNMISKFENKLKPFLHFVKNKNNLFFKMDIIEKYFNHWRETFRAFEKKAQKYNINAFYFEDVRNMLNSLLLIIDPENSIIEWTF